MFANDCDPPEVTFLIANFAFTNCCNKLASALTRLFSQMSAILNWLMEHRIAKSGSAPRRWKGKND